ncbi:type II toxin-antitoxin system VapC family toxin [Actinomycetospora sp. OC33-EN08]|uniref:Ribonuclease VapC n=1 Tax=Actinomycetospora aurantiaca TaxID=3129233 RepID=A0ABU8MN44_9PSEU
MSTFADTSAVVKLYLDEPGHEPVRALDRIVISRLARVEVVAAIWGVQRRGGLRPGSATALVAEFEADLAGPGSRFAVVEPTPAVLDDAAALSGIRGLRAYDAVQLASARAAATADDRIRTFAAFDPQLRGAAAEEGFVVVP